VTTPIVEELQSCTGGLFAEGIEAGRWNQHATLLKDGRVCCSPEPHSRTATPTRQSLASAEIYTPSVAGARSMLLSISATRKTGCIQQAGAYRIASDTDPAVAGEYLVHLSNRLVRGSVIRRRLANRRSVGRNHVFRTMFLGSRIGRNKRPDAKWRWAPDPSFPHVGRTSPPKQRSHDRRASKT